MTNAEGPRLPAGHPTVIGARAHGESLEALVVLAGSAAVKQRMWVGELRAGRNPFTELALDERRR